MPYGAGDAKVSCMRHELEHVVRASWLVQNDVGHLYLSEGKSSQVKSTTWKSSAVKGPLPKMTVYHEYTGSKTCCVTAPHVVFEPMDRDPSTSVRTHLSPQCESASTHPPIQYCSCGLDSTMEFHRGDALHAARTFYRTQALLKQYGGPGHPQPRTPRDLGRAVHRTPRKPRNAPHANTASRRQHRKPQHKRSGRPKEAAALTRPTTGREPMPPQPSYRRRAPITSR
jgi:hypothetical protein